MELPRLFSLALSLLLFSTSPVCAQSTTTSAAAPASTAVISPGNVKWGYSGCYNETTGYESTGFARALAGMEQQKSDTMTVEGCFNICNARGTSYAGLEYASECFCANHINALANKLDDSQCNLPCAGNSSQVCGGPLRLSVYTVKTQQQIDADKKKSGAGTQAVPEASILALGIAMGMMLWLA